MTYHCTYLSSPLCIFVLTVRCPSKQCIPPIVLPALMWPDWSGCGTMPADQRTAVCYAWVKLEDVPRCQFIQLNLPQVQIPEGGRGKGELWDTPYIIIQWVLSANLLLPPVFLLRVTILCVCFFAKINSS